MEKTPSARNPVLLRLRDSHHAVARLMARGVQEAEISLMTGYSVGRLAVLRQDPAFAGLLEFYRQDNREIHREVEEKLALTMLDMRQEIHERVLDNPDSLSFSELVDAFKVMADRAGYAPVQHTVNKNLNLDIGVRLDKARERKG